jgi:hypothetical protein
MLLNIIRRTIMGVLACDLESSNVELYVDFELATGWSGWEAQDAVERMFSQKTRYVGREKYGQTKNRTWDYPNSRRAYYHCKMLYLTFVLNHISSKCS